MGFFNFFKNLFNTENKITNNTINPSSNIHQNINSTKTAHYSKKRSDVFYQFDIDKMVFCFSGKHGDVDYADFYFIPSEYHEKASHNLTTINILLNNIHKNHPQIPLFQYSLSNLEFARKSSELNNFCMFCHHPLNYHGKPNMHPYSLTLQFGEMNNSFFNIYFDVHGNVAKIRFVCWSNICYIFNAKIFDKELQITSAYKNANGKKERIFDIDFEMREKSKKEYQWVLDSFPELAPKSLSSYTRIKNSNSEKYQKIKQLAAEKGKIL